MGVLILNMGNYENPANPSQAKFLKVFYNPALQ